MNKKDLFAQGKESGYNVARYNNEMNPENWNNSDIEKFESDCYEAESNSRQYSPFEFLAHDINECHNSDSLWDAYDNGITAGIQKYVKEFKRENKSGYNQNS
jgi:hypothetical protein